MPRRPREALLRDEIGPQELNSLLGPGSGNSSEAIASAAPPPPPSKAVPEDGGWIQAAIDNPVSVAVGVILVVLFGLRALFAVPIQLTPDIERPALTVTTIWPGANPQEVEREILEEQEKALKNVEGLVTMDSVANPSSSQVTLRFRPGTDLQDAMLEVNNKLNEVPEYPSEALRPVLTKAGAQEEAIGWWTILPTREGGPPIESELEFLKREVETRITRIPGVAGVNFFGGRERQFLVEVDPLAMAERGVTPEMVADALRRENRNVSAGHLDQGKRRYVLRSEGAFVQPEDLIGLVVREDPRERVLLEEIATVRETLKDPDVVVREKGLKCIAMNAQRQAGSNVLEVMNQIHEALEELNQGVLKTRGMRIEPSYDTSDYIRGALTRVRDNILLGSVLAVLLLFFFLGSVSSTLIISLAIPISAVGTFLAMFALGRNINVVSLAGLSFAVGMLVDNSIVVLENIFRLREEGYSNNDAAREGARQVQGAVLASTLTTVAVFLPLFFLQAEIGQLFRDIAIAIACAVLLSLFVSLLVIPVLATRWMGPVEDTSSQSSGLVRSIADGLGVFLYRICGSTFARIAVVGILSAVSLVGSWSLAPPAEYLPTGNQNFLFCLLIPPAGYNVGEFQRIADQVETALAPLWKGPDSPIESFFFVAWGRQIFMGAMAKDPSKVRELKGPLQGSLSNIPGTFAIVVQAGLFDSGMAGGRSIDLKLKGPDLVTLTQIAQRAFGGVMQHLPGAQPQPIPGLTLGQPELRMVPDRRRLAEVGTRSDSLGYALDVFADGSKVSSVRAENGEEIDLILRGKKDVLETLQDLRELPLSTPQGGIHRIGDLGSLVLTMGPEEIHHSERLRTITLRIRPPENLPLQTAMETLESKVLEPMRKDKTLALPYRTEMAGTADKLSSTAEELKGQLLAALVVIYLLLASLYESFLLPWVILFTVPLASFGGFLTLAGVNRFLAPQSMDVLTMLGFVILLGVVVNNAILLVDRAAKTVRDQEMTPREAVAEAASSRLRPILMSTLTSVSGMAPLVFLEGPGSELYRGIGSVVVGGLLLSTIFTLILTPALLSLTMEWFRAWIFPELDPKTTK